MCSNMLKYWDKLQNFSKTQATFTFYSTLLETVFLVPKTKPEGKYVEKKIARFFNRGGQFGPRVRHVLLF